MEIQYFLIYLTSQAEFFTYCCGDQISVHSCRVVRDTFRAAQSQGAPYNQVALMTLIAKSVEFERKRSGRTEL